MQSLLFAAALAAPLVSAQYNPPPSPVLLNTTKSGVLPVLPTNFNGTLTLEGAIISKAPANYSYVPVMGPAAVQSNLPAATYTATLPSVAFDALTGTTISGSITGYSNAGDTGVTFVVNFTGLPDLATYGPFPYHIHNMPVPSDGNCISTLGHFDYTNAGEYYACASNQTQNCQTGDLAGKHGKMNTTGSFTATYVDKYLSTDPSSPYFFGALSVVIHTSNTTRLTCANFMQVNGAPAPAAPSAPATSSTTSSPPVSTFKGAASKTMVGSALIGAALLAVGIAL